MNKQLSMDISTAPAFPDTKEAIESLWENHVSQPDDDPDAFSSSTISNGFSFFIYGVKAFELKQDETGAALCLPGNFVSIIDPQRKTTKENSLYTIRSLTEYQMKQFIQWLIETKKKNFRALITDTFACCNSFVACSDAGHCLHENNRFYNGCYYRTNLEQGRIFYGKNKNI